VGQPAAAAENHTAAARVASAQIRARFVLSSRYPSETSMIFPGVYAYGRLCAGPRNSPITTANDGLAIML